MRGELAVMRKAAILADEVMEPRDQAAEARGAGERARGGDRISDAEARSERAVVRNDRSVGWRAALPHARPTSKLLRKNELVVLDLGVILGHYCSDMTRTVYLGRAPKRVRGWYKAVQEAQAAGAAAVKAGVTCGEVDGAAREVLKKSGLEAVFCA